jgi:hypothetical protein
MRNGGRMKIEVARIQAHDKLVFTITVTEPGINPFTMDEAFVLGGIDKFMQQMEQVTNRDATLYEYLVNANHSVREKLLSKVNKNIQYSIEYELRPRFDHICKEIYNWTVDLQSGEFQTWLMQYIPQRTKFYFDNDPQMQKDVQEPDDEDEDDDD